MRITFTARHGKASEDLKQYAENEVRRLKKYYEPIIDCEIILDYVKSKQIAEINIGVYGKVLQSQVIKDDMRQAISEAVTKLERQLQKYKEKWKKKISVDKPTGMEESI